MTCFYFEGVLHNFRSAPGVLFGIDAWSPVLSRLDLLPSDRLFLRAFVLHFPWSRNTFWNPLRINYICLFIYFLIKMGCSGFTCSKHCLCALNILYVVSIWKGWDMDHQPAAIIHHHPSDEGRLNQRFTVGSVHEKIHLQKIAYCLLSFMHY